MFLDLRTLEVAAIVVCVVLGPVSLAFAPTQPYMQPSRYWGAGLIALAGGLALVNMRGHVPEFVPQVLGPGLIAVALTFAQSSARSAAGRGVRDLVGFTLLAIFILMLLALTRGSTEAWLRELLRTGALGILACRVAFGFDQGRKLPEGLALRAIGVIFGMFGAALLLQAALAPAVSFSNAGSAPDVVDALLLVGLMAGLLLGTIILMWVMTERINSTMRELVSLDPLTGALNRPAFMQQFEREAARARRLSDAPFAITLIDIDHFHNVNNVYGHDAGDRLLHATVEILRGMTRKYDLIGRLDGDVFMLLAPGTRSDGAASLAERMRRDVELQASVRAGLKNHVSVSIGVAVFGEHGDSWDTMLRAVESAAGFAKTLCGNQVQIATPMTGPPGEESGAAQGEAVPG